MKTRTVDILCYALLVLVAACDGTVSSPIAQAVSSGSSAAVIGSGSTTRVRLDVGQSISIGGASSLQSLRRSSAVSSWTSSDESVAKVSRSTVLGVRDGGAFVVGRSSQGTIDSVLVTVGTGPAQLFGVTDSLMLLTGASSVLSPSDVRYRISYQSSAASVASVSASGAVQAVAPGVAVISATNSVGATGQVRVRVVNQNVAAPSNTIAAQLIRFGGTGAAPTVVASSAIPLARGMLREADSLKVRVLVNGVEQQIYSEILRGRHADGSVRAVLVQFPTSIAAGQSLQAQVQLGVDRSLPPLTKPTVARSIPDAAVLPTDPNYLISTDLVGPTLPVSTTDQLPDLLGAKYQSDFDFWSNDHWAKYGPDYGGNYYDRAQIYYSQWVRTGRAEMWIRAAEHVMDYRTRFLDPSNYLVQPHWMMIDGVGEHYLATGDEGSWRALGRFYEKVRYFRDRASLIHPDIESRILARTLMAMLWAWQFSSPAEDGVPTSQSIKTLITNILDRQSADGSWKYEYNICSPTPGTLAYMDGMLDEALIESYRRFEQNPRIETAVKRSADFLWSQWEPDKQGVKYRPFCPPASDNFGVPELNNLMINGFAWAYATSGDFTYRQRADSLFNAGVRNSFLPGVKQFNQQYSMSFRYFAYRQGVRQ